MFTSHRSIFAIRKFYFPLYINFWKTGALFNDTKLQTHHHCAGTRKCPADVRQFDEYDEYDGDDWEDEMDGCSVDDDDDDIDANGGAFRGDADQ